MLDVNTARRQMIEQQVARGTCSTLKVLAAMERVPREEFTARPIASSRSPT